jgi:GTP-binding protein
LEVKVFNSEFLYSVPKLALMRDLGEEVCFVGRSNVGKSSLINALCQKKDLAKTAKLPGRTKHAVCYEVTFGAKHRKKSSILVDMPGFGYASMSKADAKACETLLYSYIETRSQLSLLVLLLDMRRLPDEREEQIVSLAKLRGVEILVVLTKADKIVVSKRKMAINKTAAVLKLEPNTFFSHSIHTKESTASLRELIYKAL